MSLSLIIPCLSVIISLFFTAYTEIQFSFLSDHKSQQERENLQNWRTNKPEQTPTLLFFLLFQIGLRLSQFYQKTKRDIYWIPYRTTFRRTKFLADKIFGWQNFRQQLYFGHFFSAKILSNKVCKMKMIAIRGVSFSKEATRTQI